MDRINKQSIYEILSLYEARKGLHTSSIAKHLLYKHTSLFDDSPPLNYDEVLKRVKSILTSDVTTLKGLFERVINPDTGKPRRSYYKIKTEGK
jgi:hypothetical protein